jgi:hypothetical protein
MEPFEWQGLELDEIRELACTECMTIPVCRRALRVGGWVGGREARNKAMESRGRKKCQHGRQQQPMCIGTQIT